MPLRALSDASRHHLCVIAWTLCSIAAMTLPLTFSSPGLVEAAGAPFAPAFALPQLVTHPEQGPQTFRDPFIPQEPRAEATVIPSRGGDLDDIVLPPNVGARSGAMPGADSPAIVQAVVMGSKPYALIDVAGVVRIYGVGDRIAGTTIVRIERDGVVCASGLRVPMMKEL